MQGKAQLKQRLATLGDLDATLLPYNRPLIDWLRGERALGRHVVLCSACDISIANAISKHVDVFDEVIASEGVVNLAGSHKADALERRFGRAGFDYVGNSSADHAVWNRARKAIVVNATNPVLVRARADHQVERVFERPASSLLVWRRVLRVHQWLKNFLLFVPLLAAHEGLDVDAWAMLTLAFISFSFCASSVYIANDLLDLDSDRQHIRKRSRPFASGKVAIWEGGSRSRRSCWSSARRRRHQ